MAQSPHYPELHRALVDIQDELGMWVEVNGTLPVFDHIKYAYKSLQLAIDECRKHLSIAELMPASPSPTTATETNNG